jgi:hypothetical protein
MTRCDQQFHGLSGRIFVSIKSAQSLNYKMKLMIYLQHMNLLPNTLYQSASNEWSWFEMFGLMAHDPDTELAPTTFCRSFLYLNLIDLSLLKIMKIH